MGKAFASISWFMSFVLRRKKHVFLVVCGYTALCLDMRGVCVAEFSNDAFEGWPIFVKGRTLEGKEFMACFFRLGGGAIWMIQKLIQKYRRQDSFCETCFFPPKVLIFWDFILPISFSEFMGFLNLPGHHGKDLEKWFNLESTSCDIDDPNRVSFSSKISEPSQGCRFLPYRFSETIRHTICTFRI